MNESPSPSDRELLVRLDESVNGKDTGLKDTIKRLEGKLDGHFNNHKRERNAIIFALGSALIAIFVAVFNFFRI